MYSSIFDQVRDLDASYEVMLLGTRGMDSVHNLLPSARATCSMNAVNVEIVTNLWSARATCSGPAGDYFFNLRVSTIDPEYLCPECSWDDVLVDEKTSGREPALASKVLALHAELAGAVSWDELYRVAGDVYDLSSRGYVQLLDKIRTIIRSGSHEPRDDVFDQMILTMNGSGSGFPQPYVQAIEATRERMLNMPDQLVFLRDYVRSGRIVDAVLDACVVVEDIFWVPYVVKLFLEMRSDISADVGRVIESITLGEVDPHAVATLYDAEGEFNSLEKALEAVHAL